MDVFVTSARADALIRGRTRLHMTPRAARCNSGRYARFDTGATRCPTPFRVHKKHQADNETLPSGGAETPVAISLGLSFWPEVVQAMQATQTTVQFAIIESALPFSDSSSKRLSGLLPSSLHSADIENGRFDCKPCGAQTGGVRRDGVASHRILTKTVLHRCGNVDRQAATHTNRTAHDLVQ